MNDITKSVIKRILELNIEGVKTRENGSLWYYGNVVVGAIGDVNFWSWHDRKLQHDYFKFTDQSGSVYIETQERADEFVNIVADHFDAKELTRSEKLQRVYDNVLTEIVEELTKEHGEGFEVEGRTIQTNEEDVAILVGTELRIFDKSYFECNENNDNPIVNIDTVKVRSAFNVADELCKIKMPSQLELKKTDAGRVFLYWGSSRVGFVYNGTTGKVAGSPVVDGKRKNEMNQRFGVTLKPEQGKEYVHFIAEVLGGEYDV